MSPHYSGYRIITFVAYTRQMKDTKNTVKQRSTISTKTTQNTFTAESIKCYLWPIEETTRVCWAAHHISGVHNMTSYSFPAGTSQLSCHRNIKWQYLRGETAITAKDCTPVCTLWEGPMSSFTADQFTSILDLQFSPLKKSSSCSLILVSFTQLHNTDPGKDTTFESYSEYVISNSQQKSAGQ